MATDLRPLAPQRITPAPSTDTTPLSGAQAGPCQPNGLPCLPLQPRQLRSPHEPHYRPAVLRPTERPLRHFPLTPPQSSSNSFDSLQGAESPRSWNRPSTGDGVTISASESVPEEGLLPDHEFGQVTSAPTRDHWKPDSCAPNCDAATCNKPFSLFERRHHCRRCGNVFCSFHTPFTIPLDQYARFHPDGVYSRACDHCWSKYRAWQAKRCSRANSVSSYENCDTPTTLGVSIGGGHGNYLEGPSNPGAGGVHGLAVQQVGSVAGSVPRDWAWSTF